MGVLNKRNAVFGWAVWEVGKRAAKMKAKSSVRHQDNGSRRPNARAVAAMLAAAGGTVWFWRRRRGGDEPS